MDCMDDMDGSDGSDGSGGIGGFEIGKGIMLWVFSLDIP